MLIVCSALDVCLLINIKLRKIDLKDDYLAFHEKYGFITVSFLKLIVIVFVFQHLYLETWMDGSLVFVAAYCYLVGKLLVKVIRQKRGQKEERC